MQFVSRRSTPPPIFAFVTLLFCIVPGAGAADIVANGDVPENGSFLASFQSPANDGSRDYLLGDLVTTAGNNFGLKTIESMIQGNVSVTAAPEPTSLFLLSGATILGLALWRRSKTQ